MPPTTHAPPATALRWRARVVTYGLAAALAAAAGTGSEPWPLSQFELFSGVRTGESLSWQLVAVDAQGAEATVDLAGLPPNLGLVHHLLPSLEDQDPVDQREIVRRWLAAVGADEPAPVAARVYTVRRIVPTVAGGASDLLRRSLVHQVPLP